MLDDHWPVVCAAAVLVAAGISGALLGVLYVLIRPVKGDGHA